MSNPLQFFQQARVEIAKIQWAKRREVMVTSLMVFLFASLMAAFFALVDMGIRAGLGMIVGG